MLPGAETSFPSIIKTIPPISYVPHGGSTTLARPGLLGKLGMGYMDGSAHYVVISTIYTEPKGGSDSASAEKKAPTNLDAKECSNSRPVSSLPFLGYMLEHMVSLQLQRFLDHITPIL